MVGLSLFAIAVGAILKFAVQTSVAGIDIGVVGVILMVIGGIGLVIGVALETDGGGQTAGRDV
jgi:hypothetical protein